MPRAATRLLLLGFLTFAAICFSSFWYGDNSPTLPKFQTHAGAYLPKKKGKTKVEDALEFRARKGSFEDVRNATLGFEKIYVINLLERSDKLDALSVASSLTGFRFDVVPGVNGMWTLNKTLPSMEGLPNTTVQRNTAIGSWRAHMNAIRSILTLGLSSALIMEDDTDWDYYLKDQLSTFAQGSQYVTGVESNTRPHSPYGDDWDVIWLGHCASQMQPNDPRRFLVENDKTVPLPSRRVNFADNIPNIAREGIDEHTRVIFEAGETLCTYAYALSARGARKVLRTQTKPNQERMKPFDIGLSDMCRDIPNFRCISSFPNIIGSHMAPGRVSADSDINPHEDTGEMREMGVSFNIVHSVRMNMDRLIYGEEVESQFPDDEGVTGPARTKTLHRQS